MDEYLGPMDEYRRATSGGGVARWRWRGSRTPASVLYTVVIREPTTTHHVYFVMRQRIQCCQLAMS